MHARKVLFTEPCLKPKIRRPQLNWTFAYSQELCQTLLSEKLIENPHRALSLHLFFTFFPTDCSTLFLCLCSILSSFLYSTLKKLHYFTRLLLPSVFFSPRLISSPCLISFPFLSASLKGLSVSKLAEAKLPLVCAWPLLSEHDKGPQCQLVSLINILYGPSLGVFGGESASHQALDNWFHGCRTVHTLLLVCYTADRLQLFCHAWPYLWHSCS